MILRKLIFTLALAMVGSVHISADTAGEGPMADRGGTAVEQGADANGTGTSGVVSVQGVSLFSITGRVQLQDFTGDVTRVPVTAQLRKYGGGTINRPVWLNSDGSFFLGGIEPGTYDVALKANHWLRNVVSIRIGSITTGVNVRDYGAVGDGVHDDTVNIQNAIRAAQATNISEPSINTSDHYTAPEVYFPHGNYRITSTLTISSINLVGEGNAFISMTNANNVVDTSKDIITGTTVWRARIKGLTFYGGRQQLDIGSNWEDGHIIIEKCDFYSSGGAAIYLRNATGTLAEIQGCMFMACDQVLINYSRECKLSNSWITTSPTMSQKAAMVNYTSLCCEQVLGVPSVTSDSDQRWIDNYNQVTCRRFRFGGEDAGMTPVVNFAAYDYTDPIVPTSVIIENCEASAGGNHKRPSIVYLEAIPNKLVIRDCRRMIAVPFISWNPSLDLTTALANAPWSAMDFSTRRNGITAPWCTDLPEPMRPYQEGDILGDAQPTSGTWRRGQFVRNRNLAYWQVWTPLTAPPPDGIWYGSFTVYNNPFADAKLAPYGWLCTADGTPGNWQTISFEY